MRRCSFIPIRKSMNSSAVIHRVLMRAIEIKLVGPTDPNPTGIKLNEIQQYIDNNIIKYFGEQTDIRPFLKDSSVVVLPSYREGLSRVLLEAASMAKPIITTDVPGCRDVVLDGINGFLCKVKDVKSLARQMDKMLNLEISQRIEMGKQGREKVIKEFDEKVVIEKYKQALANIL